MTPACLTKAETAARLGISKDSLRRLLPSLRAAGFPDPDPLLFGRYLAADVEAWLATRHRIAEHPTPDPETQEPNYDAL